MADEKDPASPHSWTPANVFKSSLPSDLEAISQFLSPVIILVSGIYVLFVSITSSHFSFYLITLVAVLFLLTGLSWLRRLTHRSSDDTAPPPYSKAECILYSALFLISLVFLLTKIALDKPIDPLTITDDLKVVNIISHKGFNFRSTTVFVVENSNLPPYDLLNDSSLLLLELQRNSEVKEASVKNMQLRVVKYQPLPEGRVQVKTRLVEHPPSFQINRFRVNIEKQEQAYECLNNVNPLWRVPVPAEPMGFEITVVAKKSGIYTLECTFDAFVRADSSPVPKTTHQITVAVIESRDEQPDQRPVSPDIPND